MTTVVHYLDRETEPYFKNVCQRIANERGVIAIGVKTGRELVESAKLFEDGSVGHHIIGAHGGTTWLLSSKHGVSVQRTNSGPHQVALSELVRAWGPKYAARVNISLAACMCSRSPHWYLKRLFGKSIPSAWGPRSYRPGGQASFSARYRDQLIWEFNRVPDVRGHRSEGDMTGNALLAKHGYVAGDPCVSLFKLCFPQLEPTLDVRHKWTRDPKRGGIVLGPRAERWLLHDDSVIDAIRALW